MPAARGVKRTASKSSAATASTGPKNKKKRGAIQLEIPVPPKRKGCVMTCGQGDVGQLGLGEDVMETTKFKTVSVLGNKIVDVVAGGMHTVALDSDGKVWTFGCNDEGALGRPTSSDTDEGTPKQVTLPLPAVAVSAGDSHSAALLENGDVFAWGSFRDSHGSMGLVVRGREGKPCKEPVRVDIGESAVGVASGGDHLVILTNTGSVYTMGCGEQGQLGRLAQRSASRDARQGFSALLVPSKVILKGGACRVWAGYHATFVMDATSDKMFAWGLNNYGQLGITGEKRKTAIYSPTECDGMRGRRWSDVSAGQHHSLAVDERGLAYSVGRCEYGRLGLGREGDAESWEAIPKLQQDQCVCVSAGTSSSFAVTQAGRLMSWGAGGEGQLGGGAADDQLEPALVQLEGRAVRVTAGGQHTVVLVEDPTAQTEVTPTPESEKEGENTESTEDKKKQNRRQKKQEQDEEITSTSSAQNTEVKDEPEKVNGNEKKDTEPETPMDVNETDKQEDIEDKMDTQEQNEQTTTDKRDEQTDTQGDSKDMDTSSQDTTSETDAVNGGGEEASA
ncbi:unnamed protein product [Danaus chrysippus]|uniref:(African queen) hypothetical protein n=1 Tax=Danaus chrysippus TaxID=151541 RepID=A0A8J2W842_9NEOP|nr:unnamed protein product [Danaus chrysippus]